MAGARCRSRSSAPGRAQCPGQGRIPGVASAFPRPPQNFGAHYLRFIPRNEMDIAVVGVGSSVVLGDDRATVTAARVALGAVAPTPLLVEKRRGAGRQAELGCDASPRPPTAAQAAAKPISDMRGTVEQRRHLVGVLTRRTLQSAIATSQRGGVIMAKKYMSRRTLTVKRSNSSVSRARACWKSCATSSA